MHCKCPLLTQSGHAHALGSANLCRQKRGELFFLMLSMPGTSKAAQVLNIKLQPFQLREPSELVSAFEKMERTHAEAVETGDDTLSVGNVGAIVALASRARLLLIGPDDVPRAGGVIGYGADFVAIFRRAAIFVDRYAKPADLPIERVWKFQFILNRKVAQALGFEIPQSILSAPTR